jgi:hypothetical protein
MTKSADIAHPMPHSGGSYMRLENGSLVQVEEHTQPAPIGQPEEADGLVQAAVETPVEQPVEAPAKPAKARQADVPTPAKEA